MRVLVTGATGFTGGHLACELAARGHSVRAFVREANRARHLEDRGIELCVGDLINAADCQRAVADCEVVYHIAALYREAKHPDAAYRQVNVEGTKNILDAAEAEHVRRVVHCSTVGVHGDVAVPADETAPYAPGDIYQRTKLEAEQIARARFSNGLAGTIVRPAAIYGPGDSRFLKLFRSIKQRTFRMIGSGETLYHMVYIDDLVDGLIRCGEHPRAVGQTYILAGPRYTTLNELVAATAKSMGCAVPRGRIPLRPVMLAARVIQAVCVPLRLEPPLHPRRVAFFTKDRGFCSDKATREIGYAPQVDLETGLERTARWYKMQGVLCALLNATLGLA